MKKYTANYSYSNHNFVIQNLEGERINNEYLPAICILKNILQRGKPTLLSTFLQEKLGQLHKQKDFEKAYPLIDKEPPKWERIIRGNVKGNHYPAQKFFEEVIPKHLPEYKFIQQLIIPEIPIKDITKVDVKEFGRLQVDFYLPQAYLIIEIDGSQHLIEPQLSKDRMRDVHTSRYGIKTVRIQVSDLEDENENFVMNINEIKDRIDKAISSQAKRKEDEPTFISLTDYQYAFQNGVDLKNPNYISTAIIRFQLLVLVLLENGTLTFNKSWKFELLERDISGFAKIAIEDLIIWLKHIFKLQKIDFIKPKYSIKKCSPSIGFSNNSATIKIDFSLLKRYTDEIQNCPDVIFVRTNYLDEYRYFNMSNAAELHFSSFEPYDYFRISSTEPFEYKLLLDGENSDEPSLLFLLWNIFLQNDDNLEFESLEFFEGQLPIIVNALARNDTIGLLPTGSGKSVCYQLASILQPAISFVVCPIKALMYDQKADLDYAHFSRTNHITSDDDGEEKERILSEFAKGKYFFIFISPERFQIKTFREKFSVANEQFKIAYAVVDEVHCLSEWGHDFRTSYLNLAKTIRKHCTDFNFIGLTATASINVLKDIQIEFGIDHANIKTPADYTRKELDFIIINDEHRKNEILIRELDYLKQTINAFREDGNNTKAGIIFTPTVNGQKGCYQLSERLQNHFNTNVSFFSGQLPKELSDAGWDEKKFETHKQNVQNDFKQNKLSLLTATKAFGMGVNKRNIHYTFHYGIPGSMESLYQEAGRAGRDRIKFSEQKAKCFVLLSKTNNEGLLKQVWNSKTSFSKFLDKVIDANGNEITTKILSRDERIQYIDQGAQIIDGIIRRISGDINTQLFLFSNSLDVINQEFETIKKLLAIISESETDTVSIRGVLIECNKAKAEKAIYRLSQLGVIDDWIINNFFNDGSFMIYKRQYSEESIKNSLLATIQKYDKEFSFEAILNEEKYSVYKKILKDAPDSYTDKEKYILILLQWSYDNFAYNRRKSLKDIYELCCNYKDSVEGKAEFKRSLEAYFKFTQKSYIFDHIAENPRDYKKWFEVFYQMNNDIITDKFILREEQKNLKNNLNRFLQSYQHNTGLNLISGFLRLLLDLNEYRDNDDGDGRFESSLEQIQNYESEHREFIFDQIIKIGQHLNNENKSDLAESLYKIFHNKETLLRISKSLGDSFSLAKLVELSTNKLKTINRKLYGGLG